LRQGHCSPSLRRQPTLRRLTINEDIDFVNEVFTFTTPPDGQLCPSGTFADEVRAVGGVNVPTLPKANILIETVYTCDDGSGTFFAQKHVFLTFNEDGSQTNTGPISRRVTTPAIVVMALTPAA
jgi:hypothetical protein